MSNADRTTVQIAEETTFGTAPTSGYRKMRFTSETMTRETSTTNSATIRPDRQIEDVVRTSVNASMELASELDLSINMELDLFEAAFGASASTVVATTIFDQADSTTDFSFEVYDSVGTPKHGIARDNGSDALTAYSAGDWIRVEVPNNNAATVGSEAEGSILGGGYFRVVSSAAASLELEGSEITADGDMTDNTIFRDADIVWENGVAERSFTIQKSFGDVDSGEGMQAVGMTIDTLSISVSPENIITKSITFQGQNASHLSALTTSGQLAASTETILNAIDHVAGIYCTRGTTGQNALMRPLPGVTSFDINIQNGLRMRNEVGTLGPASFGQSAINVNGSLTVYYDASTSDIIETLYEGFEDGSLAIAFEEAAVNKGEGYVSDSAANTTNALVLYMPRVKFVGATRNATGTGTDVMAELQFQAFYDPTAANDATIQAFMWAS